MKDLGQALQHVTGYLADLNLDLNDLDKADQSDEDLLTGSNSSLPDNPDGVYLVAKGPVVKAKRKSNQGPYPSQGQDTFVDGFFLDDPSRVSDILDNAREASEEEEEEAVEYPSFDTGIPALPSTSSSSRSTACKIFYVTKASSYGCVTVHTFVTIDQVKNKFVLKLPRRLLKDAKAEVDAFVQIVPGDRRLLKFPIQLGQEKKVFMQRQTVVIHSFQDFCSIQNLLEDVDEATMQRGRKLINVKDIADLTRCGSSNVSLLMALCHRSNENAAKRSEIYALVHKVLVFDKSSAITQKNSDGLSTLDFAITSNNARIAMFLAEIFYILNVDPMCVDEVGNNILHVVCRIGDSSSDALNAMLKLKTHSGRMIFDPLERNKRGQLPIHIAAMSPKHPLMVLHTLARRSPESLTMTTTNGSTPLHLACQYSQDPALVAALLCYDKTTISQPRADGFTALHLLASRSVIQDTTQGLIKLDHDEQLLMIKLLLDENADKSALVGGLYQPQDLLASHLIGARDLLKVARQPESSSHSSCPQSPFHQQDSSSSLLMNPSNDPVMSITSSINGLPPAALDDHCRNEDVDAIAKAFICHPTIQAIVDSSVSMTSPDEQG